MGVNNAHRTRRARDMRPMGFRAASYRSTGPFAGKVVSHRNVDGPQLWKIVISVVNLEGTLDTHVIKPLGKLYLSELQGVVQRSIDEVCPPGERVRHASMEFFVNPAL